MGEPARQRLRKLKVNRGLDLPIAGAPVQAIEDAAKVKSVALLGRDYPGVRPELLVKEGDEVAVGTPVFRDRKRPEILLTSPGRGRIDAIHRGARRALQAVVIELAEEGPAAAAYEPLVLSAATPRETIQARLCEAGLWSAFRTRPFSRIPDPGSTPKAIFVTAVDTNPLAADPAVVISGFETDIQEGLTALSRLTDGPVYFCHGSDLQIALPALPTLVDVQVQGPHPAGLPGTHIHLLDPASEHSTVWHLNYQDLIAIGRLFCRGEFWLERVIAAGGPVLRRPRLLRTRLGASTTDLLQGELTSDECRVISGSVLAGHHAAGWARYLGRYHLQLSVIAEGREREFMGWMMPGFGKFSALRAYASSLLPRRFFAITTSQQGSPRAMVPIGNFEKVMPLDILPAPLLKALIVEDTDNARALGCLELDEEDLALCTFVCCSKYDYGAALRSTLNKIQAGA